MSRKDYELIARALRASRYRASDAGEIRGIAIATNLLADGLESDNPRFDRARFVAATMTVDNSTSSV